MDKIERRSGTDRRTGQHRRQNNAPDYNKQDRRIDWEERSGKDRRKTT